MMHEGKEKPFLLRFTMKTNNYHIFSLSKLSFIVNENFSLSSHSAVCVWLTLPELNYRSFAHLKQQISFTFDTLRSDSSRHLLDLFSLLCSVARAPDIHKTLSSRMWRNDDVEEENSHKPEKWVKKKKPNRPTHKEIESE